MIIRIVGLGSGDKNSLTMGTYKLLVSGKQVWLRTAKHPLVSWLKEEGINFQTFDDIYEKHSTFEDVYHEIVDSLLRIVSEHQEVIYAVPGHPMVAEQTVMQLIAESKKRQVELDIRGAESFLDTAFARLQIDPIAGFSLLNGDELHVKQVQPHLHLFIAQVYDRFVASDVKLTLLEVYPEDIAVTIVDSLGVHGAETIKKVPLYQLDHETIFGNLTSLYIPPFQESWGLRRRFETVVDIFQYLRSPDGCPWDRKQTHQSLRPYLLEEAYEVLEAIDEDDPELMIEELGDLLLQVLLHAQIAREAEDFDIYDVIETLSDKMIRRHPHVFGTTNVANAEEVITNWEEIKRMEKGGRASQSLLADIPKGLPAIQTAWEIQKKAKKVGFDWEDIVDVEKKVMEEWQELLLAESPAEREEEFGDLLFSLINLARFLDIHPEMALISTNRKFRNRFAYIEAQAHEQNVPLQGCTLEQLDKWWEEAKESNAT